MGTLFQIDGTTGDITKVGNITASGTITSTTGDITLQNQHSVVFQDTELSPKSVTLHSPTTLTNSYTLIWPLDQGGVGTALVNDGSGNLSFATFSATPAGADTQIQFNNSGSFGADPNFSWSTTPFPHLSVQGTGGSVAAATFGSANGTNIQFFAGVPYVDPQLSEIDANPDGSILITTSLQTVNTQWKFLEGSFTFPLLLDNTAVTSPTEGMLIATSDIHDLQYYNGTTWITLGGGTPAGSDTQIQYNNSGTFGASGAFTWDNTSQFVSISATGGNVAAMVFNSPSGNGQAGVLDFEINNGEVSEIDANEDGSISLRVNLTAGPEVDWIFGADGGLQYPNLSAEPGSPVEGELIYNSSTHVFEYWDGTVWKTVATV